MSTGSWEMGILDVEFTVHGEPAESIHVFVKE